MTMMPTDNDLDVLKHADRFSVNAGTSLRSSGWVAGQWVQYTGTQQPPGNQFTVEKSSGVTAAGFLLVGSENYSNPRISTYRNYTSYQNAGSISAAASGASVITMVAGGGKFLFRYFETTSLNAFGVRSGPPAVYSVQDTLKVSENGLLCNDPDAELLLATGGVAVIPVGICCFVPTIDNPKLGLDLKY